MIKYLKLTNLIFVLIHTFSILVYSHDYVVENVEFYQKNNYLVPCMKKKPGYLELHIASAKEEGVSTNVFKIMDTSRSKGLLIVNGTDEKYLDTEKGYFRISVRLRKK